jgi:tetratricopeptide (TPR) repeat protein
MLDLGRYEEASALLARVVSAEPGSGRAWCLLARAHLGAERHQAAIDAANRAAAIDPAEEWPHRLASNALMHLGNHAEALRAAHESRRLAPSYWQTHVCVAQAALAAAQYAVAAGAATEARRLAPNEPDVYFLSGKVALARGDLDSAREHQEKALSLDPAHSGAMNELGRIRLRRHDTAGAIKHFINAARTTPGEHIYSRNIDVVVLRTVSRLIYFFVLAALLLLWVPTVMHMSRFPFAVAFGCLILGTVVSAVVMTFRLPREARFLVRRTLRSRRVLTAILLAACGVTAAFASVTFVSPDELPQTLPIAFIVAVAARVAASARLRAQLTRKRQLRPPLPECPWRYVAEPAAAPVGWSPGQRDIVRVQSSGVVMPLALASSASQSSAGTRHRISNSMPLGSFAYSDFDSTWSLSPTSAPASRSLTRVSASSSSVPTSHAR